MTHDLTDWQKTVYDAVLWLTAELRRDPKMVLPYYVEQIVLAAEAARENERIVPRNGREVAKPANQDRIVGCCY
jgi:hypothetical protein